MGLFYSTPSFSVAFYPHFTPPYIGNIHFFQIALAMVTVGPVCLTNCMTEGLTNYLPYPWLREVKSDTSYLCLPTRLRLRTLHTILLKGHERGTSLGYLSNCKFLSENHSSKPRLSVSRWHVIYHEMTSGYLPSTTVRWRQCLLYLEFVMHTELVISNSV